MIKKLLRIFLLFAISNSIFGQQTEDTEIQKSNPIIYVEGFAGGALVPNIALAAGAELNFQYKKSLFSFRYTEVQGYKKNETIPFFPVPTYYTSTYINEYALLYGLRWVKEKSSFSFSAGISYSNYKAIDRDEDYNYTNTYNTYGGVPFELNWKWFGADKRSRPLWNILIPSGGVKVFGNISKGGFIGVGGTIGLGLNKHY